MCAYFLKHLAWDIYERDKIHPTHAGGGDSDLPSPYGLRCPQDGKEESLKTAKFLLML